MKIAKSYRIRSDINPEVLVFKYQFLRAVMRHFFFYQIMFCIVFNQVTVFAETGLTAPDIQLHRFP